MKLKYRLASALATLALVVGAVPMTVSPAAAVETGQLLDKGPRWPHKTAHFVTLGLGIAALVTAVVLLSDGDRRPTSP